MISSNHYHQEFGAAEEVVCFGLSHRAIERLKFEIANACQGFWERRGMKEPGSGGFREGIEACYRANRARSKFLATSKAQRATNGYETMKRSALMGVGPD